MSTIINVEVELTEVEDTKHDQPGTKLRIGVAAVGTTQKYVLTLFGIKHVTRAYLLVPFCPLDDMEFRARINLFV